MWKCQCGQENDDFSKFCPACGSRMNESDPDSADNTEKAAIEDADIKGEKTDESSVVIVRSASTWICSCGEINPGKSGICRVCGKSSSETVGSLSYPVFEPPKEEPSVAETLEAPVFSEPTPVYTPEASSTYTPAPAMPVSGWRCDCGYLNTEKSNFCCGCGRPNPTSASTFTPVAAPVSEPAAEASAASTEETAAPVVEAEPDIKLPITTSQGFEGKKIAEYIDIVCGTDIYTTGGFANTLQYSYSFDQAKKELMKKAHGLGADAVISVNTTVFSPQDTVVVVSVSGTCVKFESED